MSERNKIIAVDFDGTLCEDCYPGLGRPNNRLIEQLIQQQKDGHRLILWTCRKDALLDQAVEWCAEQGLIFDAVNENLPEIIERFHGDSRKIFADHYIDDKNITQLCHSPIRYLRRGCGVRCKYAQTATAIME